jgi:multicomponent Na+:H+ antiporter subunit E
MKYFGIVHIMVALVWLFLSGNMTTGGFLVALLGTYFLLMLFRKAIGCESYVRRVRAFFAFFFGLLTEIVLSNLRIIRICLSKEAPDIEGEFIEYDVKGLTDFEVILIAYCIGLSPGTMAADRSEDGDPSYFCDRARARA